MQQITHFRPKIRSRHPSHYSLRQKGAFPLFPFKSVIRLGSFTELEDDVTNGGNRIEINTVAAIKNSANKLLMKKCFTENEVITSDWWTFEGNDVEIPYFSNYNGQDVKSIENLPYPIISKHIFGSRGTGNKKHNTAESLLSWIEGKNLDNYIFERFYNFAREYRLHITEEGCFYTCRKMLKAGTPNEAKWYRNDEHCVWIKKENPSFDIPSNWDKIVEHSVKALKSVGLDFGAVDVKVQSAVNSKGKVRENPEFIIIEINSAPSFGETTAVKYLEVLPKLLLIKSNK